MNYQGDINLGDTIDIKFTTVSTTGVPTTLAGSPAVAAYVDNSTTEITAGLTLSVDFDSRTGLHNVRVVASSGNGFATATNVNLVITAGTVGGNSVVGYVVGSFSVEKRSALRATTAGRTLDVNTGGEAGVDLDNTSGTLAKGTDITGFNDIAAGAAMTLTSAYDAAKTAATQASVNAVDDFVDTEVAAIKVTTDKLDTALELDGAVYRYTANALEQAPAGGGGGGDASQATLLAVKAKTDNLPTDPADASDIAASFTTVNGKLDAIDDFVDTEVSGIKSKTDQLQFNGSSDLKVTLDGEQVTLTTSALNDVADAILKRDWTALSGEAAYSLLNAARMLRNVWSTTGGTLSVKKEDGSTNAWTRTLATDPSAEPIVGAS